MKHLILLALMLVSQFTFAGDDLNKGDSVALGRLAAMLEQIGGRAAWAEARSLYTMEKARSPHYGDGIVSESWHDLESPGSWGDIKHPRFNARYAWSPEGGWIGREGEYRDMIDDEIKEKTFYWHRDIYTLFHQLAIGDQGFTLETIQPNGFRVLDQKYRQLAEFHLTADNEVYRFIQLGGKGTHAYIYGPYRSFGNTQFPDWSTSTDGKWGAYYVQVMPSSKPFREQVSVKKPVLEWHGGAVKNNCEP